MAENLEAEKQRVKEIIAKVADPNLSKEDMIKEYDKWAQTYESVSSMFYFELFLNSTKLF